MMTSIVRLSHIAQTRQWGVQGYEAFNLKGERNVKVVSWSLAIWGGITFVVCVLYGLLVPGSLSMHQALGQVLPV